MKMRNKFWEEEKDFQRELGKQNMPDQAINILKLIQMLNEGNSDVG